MANNKIIYGGNVLIDLTGDTVEQSDVLTGKIFHYKSGEIVTGTCTFDSDTSDATAVAGDILVGETAYARGSLLTGTMPNRGAVAGELVDASTPYVIQNGYHDGSGTVGLSSADAAKLIPANIRQDIVILGVTGTMSGSEDVHAQTKTVTPLVAAATYTPDTGYNYFSEFTVSAIPYTETPNAAGGVTVTIAGV